MTPPTWRYQMWSVWRLKLSLDCREFFQWSDSDFLGNPVAVCSQGFGRHPRHLLWWIWLFNQEAGRDRKSQKFPKMLRCFLYLLVMLMPNLPAGAIVCRANWIKIRKVSMSWTVLCTSLAPPIRANHVQIPFLPYWIYWIEWNNMPGLKQGPFNLYKITWVVNWKLS